MWVVLCSRSWGFQLNSALHWAAVDERVVTWFLVLCSLLCRKESLENKRGSKPEANQMANSDNKVRDPRRFSPLFQNDSP